MSDRGSAPRQVFQNAEAYERMMGRWSRRLAPLLIRFGGVSDGDRVLDVGCGTGSLSFTLPEITNVAAVAGIDLTPAFVEFARTRSTDPRFTFRQADARALPFEDDSFDRAYSMLALQFIPDAARAVSEMRRVVRPGGTVTAAVWDDFSGLPHVRLLWDIAATLDPAIERPLFRPLSAPNEMEGVWREVGLVDVVQTSLLIRMEFSCFDDYWSPFLAGEGPHGQLVVGLSDTMRTALQGHVHRAYLGNRPDGPRSFVCVAWACRGIVPAS